MRTTYTPVDNKIMRQIQGELLKKGQPQDWTDLESYFLMVNESFVLQSLGLKEGKQSPTFSEIFWWMGVDQTIERAGSK